MMWIFDDMHLLPGLEYIPELVNVIQKLQRPFLA